MLNIQSILECLQPFASGVKPSLFILLCFCQDMVRLSMCAQGRSKVTWANHNHNFRSTT